MTGTLEEMLAVAARNVGFVEGKNNRNPYGPLVGHADNQPWCASFVAAVAKRAGVRLPSTSAYTPTMAGGFKAQGRWHTDFGRPGDIVFFHWPAMGRIAHVGIVEKADPGTGTYVCIEGNTDVAGGRTGGRVMRQVRRANIAGFGRPVYARPAKKATAKDAPASPTLALGSGGPRASAQERGKVRDIQRALHKLGYAPKAAKASAWIDGEMGPVTVSALKAFQKHEGLPVNGVTTVQTWAQLRRRVH